MRENEPRFYRAEQVRALDQAAIDGGIDAYTLMQRAAAAAWRAAFREWPRSRDVLVFCGSGNNGGDGYLVAALAHDAGCRVQVFAAQPPKSTEAKQARAYWAERGGITEEWPSALPAADLIVDALLGTGVTRDVDGDISLLIKRINEARASAGRVVSLDMPSGLNSDSGAVMGVAVQADLTVSFVGRKIGLYTGEGPSYSGTRRFDDLQIPETCTRAQSFAALGLGHATLRSALPPRAGASHKGSSGRVLVIGGAPGLLGASVLAGRAALRAGAGLVQVAIAPELASATAAAQPELMIQSAQAEHIAEQMRQADCVLIGPGLGRSAWARALLAAALESRRPLVLDADALNLLADEPHANPDWVLTPHPGEAARLLGCSTAEVQADRPAALRSLLQKYGGSVVLKGAGTLVQGKSGVMRLCPHGNPGMAVGGMGDVLAGIIAAFRAQGLDAERAAAAGVAAHAVAADRLAASGVQRGLLPLDVVEALPSILEQSA